MSCWSYYNPVELRFGAGQLAELPALVRRRPALLVTTGGFTRRGVADQIRELLAGAPLRILDDVQPNPDLAAIERACADLAGDSVELIVALGGGSAIDTAKALSFALPARAPGLLRAHFETGAALPEPSLLPVIAVPTTAGTGSEVTPFAAIWDRQRAKKYSLAHPRLHPRCALLDPELTLSLPDDVTIASGLDALSQAFEAIWNRNATPISTLYAHQAIALIFKSLPRLLLDPQRLELRAAMLEASLLAGLAISQTRTALAHSISYPITARYGVPHGLACSFTLPTLLGFNAVSDDGRLAATAAWLGAPSIGALRDRVFDLLLALGVDRMLREYLAAPEDVLGLAPDMLMPGRADNNMRAASEHDVVELLAAALEPMVGAPVGRARDLQTSIPRRQDS
jgi:phosphonate metabolism-associated iron-containing alcohol dehydrogenase